MSKSLDVFSHNKLLNKLEIYGIDTHWFVDYLHANQQQVKITKDGTQSKSRMFPNATECIKVDLCPVFFSICVNGLYLYTENIKIVQCTDDTRILISNFTQRRGLIKDLKNELPLLLDWFAPNRITLNAC